MSEKISKVFVVLGATGVQGGSLVKALLNDTSRKWKIRAVTRDPTKPEAKDLESKGIEVVKADLGDIESLRKVFVGANFVFGVTDFWSIMRHETERGQATVSASDETSAYNLQVLQRTFDLEVQDGKNLVDAVASIANTTLERFIWSDLPAVKNNSNGKYVHCYHFDSKAAVKMYIQSARPEVAKKTVYLQLASYMSNWKFAPVFRPIKCEDGVYEFRSNADPHTIFPRVEAIGDTGKLVLALLDAPAGTTLLGAGTEDTHANMAALWGKILGVPARFKQVSSEECAAAIPYGAGLDVAQGIAYTSEFGWDGGKLGSVLRPEDVGLKGKMTTLEEYIKSEDWSSVINW